MSCSQGDQESPKVEQMSTVIQKSQPIVSVDKFSAPTSNVITTEKAKYYAKASAGLIELGANWSERIDKATDNDKIQILNAYNVARDQLCSRAGLAGIAEYDWITSVALPDPKNKATFEQVGVKTPN